MYKPSCKLGLYKPSFSVQRERKKVGGAFSTTGLFKRVCKERGGCKKSIKTIKKKIVRIVYVYMTVVPTHHSWERVGRESGRESESE